LPALEVTGITVTGVTDMAREPGQSARNFPLQPDDEFMTPRPAPTHHLARNGLSDNYASRTILRMYVRWGAASFVALGLISVASVAL